MVVETQVLQASPAASRGAHQEEAGSEVEDPGLEPQQQRTGGRHLNRNAKCLPLQQH